ncbi:Uncharacterised protein [Serratia quinivorans]|nr:Uncharacterised protein [Serratia quinivorans]CAI1016280.1 Uncharacterised protein [Serratia quinivorans]CAI1805568.1 Uncharacterised protein [Serratia quinivorans]CAI2113089.1 Uncharacterised protein [Serratia quinivorans]CAI2455444.1 Uncharacterised protein [Serratia quinivorans]
MTMGIQTTEDERHICIFVMRLKVTSRFDAVQWGGGKCPDMVHNV